MNFLDLDTSWSEFRVVFADRRLDLCPPVGLARDSSDPPLPSESDAAIREGLNLMIWEPRAVSGGVPVSPSGAKSALYIF